MLCDVCDWLLPRPERPRSPEGRSALARGILGIVYFSSVCLLFRPSSFRFGSGGVSFQLETDELVFFCQTKPLLTGEGGGGVL